MDTRERFDLAYRAIRLTEVRHAGTSSRDLGPERTRLAVAVALGRKPAPPPDRWSYWRKLATAYSKAIESRAYWAKHLPNQRSKESIQSLRCSVDYLMWEAWMYVASARAERTGDDRFVKLLQGCRSQFRIALAAWREVQAGQEGVNVLACRLLREKTNEQLPTEMAVMVAEGMILNARGAA
jgi:hypothetical protein